MKDIDSIDKFIFVTFLLVGLAILIVMGIAFNINSFNGKAGPIQAVITDLREKKDSEGDITYTPYVEYIVDGQRYGKWLNVSSNMYENGDIIEIYYSEDDPENTSVKVPQYVRYICYSLPLIFCIIGGFGTFKLLKEKLRKRLVKTGKRVEATITNVDYNRSYSVNGRNPLKIYCNFVDIDGNYYEFESDNIWKNLNIDLNHSKMIPVYVDPDDYSKYYVNVEEYLKNI